MPKAKTREHSTRILLNSVGIGALVAAGICFSPLAHAQAPSGGGEVEQVVVTGSRVATNGMQAPTPVTAVSGADLVSSQPKSLIESLTQLPALSTSLSPQSAGIGSTGGTVGGSYLNLRNLNPVRTLVLIDGQRTVPTTGLGITDVGLFPTALIKRVDIVTGGASAAYGSDAVAGVVNFVIDTNYSGFKGDILGTTSGHGDSQGGKVALTYGDTEFGGSGHFIISGEYYNNDGIPNEFGRDWALRSIAPIANPAVSTANPASPTNPSKLVEANVRSAQAMYGGLITSGLLKGTQFLPGGVPAPFNYGTLLSSATMVGGDGVDAYWNLSLEAAQRRADLYSRYTYDVNDNLSVFVEGMWGGDHTIARSNIPYEVSNLFTITSDNIFLPAATKALMTANKISSFTMGRFDSDFSPTGMTMIDTLSNTENITAGANWKLNDWSVDAFFTHGENHFHEKTLYDQNYLRLFNAVDAIANPASGGVAGVAAGAPICRSTLTTPGNGCVPINLFGLGSPSAAALAYAVGTAENWQKTQQNDFSISANGKPFSLWAGPVAIGTGFEYRNTQARQTVDPDSAAILSTAGIQGIPANLNGAYGTWERTNPQPFTGSVNVREGFVETLIPLASGAEFAEELNLNAAARYTDYSTSGSATTWKVGMTYQPIDDVHFRATRSRDLRAPNIYELDTPVTQAGSGSSVTDPTKGGITVTGVNILSAGNPNLKPEKADTYTAGFVLEPHWIAGLSMSVDYYSVKIAGQIAQLGGQQIINQCAAGFTSLCPFVIRTNGTITYVNNQYVNIANFKANGVDMEADYSINLADMSSDWDGSLRLRALTNYIGDFLTQNPGVAVVNRGGDVGSNSTPHWQSLLTAAYDNGPWSATLTERLIGSGKYDSSLGAKDINVNQVDAAAYTAVTLSYKVDALEGQYEIYGTVNNLFDADPPASGSFSIDGVVPTNKTLFDVIGRDFSLGIRFNY